MTNRDLIAVGASAGGVEALRALVAGLPADLPAAVLVVLHLPRSAPSALPQILTRSGPLPAAIATDGEEPAPGRIYVAPADRHLLVLDGRIRLSHGPAENGHRPAVDPLFRSAARALADRVIAVVLSGSGDDGAVGAAAVAAAGGAVVVQAPEDALHPTMPRAVLTRVPRARVAVAAELGVLLAELSREKVPGLPGPDDPLLAGEVAIDAFGEPTTDLLPGEPSGFGCPSCGGALFTFSDSPVPRFRCRVGHAWSPESLLDEQAVATEGALWQALRALEEKAELGRRMAGAAGGRSYQLRFEQMAVDATEAGALIRGLLDRLAGSSATQQE
ncbi:two-component system, chemotaxis family, response regulator CheB [Actinoplanes sp. SE50]|uniref:chemotaxis protein CheB n=1 Tax=unclassified Actinoplanes TaxID=2626549 RepID=UPI00023EC5CC|nr:MULTISPECIES: chemotaxis protein CheB [unclassified Actinoplanes]AEV83622.1 two-component system, chemotaxis family, response regulator CheB [Actinoplanes sp. SE50/110]ATO82234.1 two-component system, chemotaxis family, response regulator CheB [Actinoplanes sp. SE50]SLL99641.1 transcriptional regulator [Actinoplanes sp. SE50/110]